MAAYARLEIVSILIATVVATVAVALLWSLWAIIPAVVGLALLSFYRDPPRRVPRAVDVVLAPADGKLVDVRREVAGPDGEPVLRFMIFLSVLNVHINRSPCAGRVADVQYHPGEFLNALRPEADVRNEHNTLTLDTDEPLPGPVRVRQIAGVLARRIVCAARPGESLAAGQRYGMIKLGSRTELCLPEHPDWEILARVGDRVRAGTTVLARLRPGVAGAPAVAQGPDYLSGSQDPPRPDTPEHQ